MKKQQNKQRAINEQLFQNFRDANRIEMKPAFGKGVTYNFEGKTYTETELRETEAYAGFIGGYYGNTPRKRKETGTTFLRRILHRSTRKAKVNAREELTGMLEGLMSQIEGQMGLYNKQYQLGDNTLQTNF
jgi:hypothetical protein